MLELKRMSIIREPNKFILQNVKEQEICCIHVLGLEDYLVTYKMNKPLHERFTFESRCPIPLKEQQKEKVLEVVAKIEQLDKIYHNYIYLFLFKHYKPLQPYLLSYSFEETPYSYDMVIHLSKILKLPILKPTWAGPFSNHINSAFIEDVFIQKK